MAKIPTDPKEERLAEPQPVKVCGEMTRVDGGTTESPVCWQCGAPADAACTYFQKLCIARDLHANARGLPVTHGWESDTVQIPVPRCARCQFRNSIIALLIGAATFVGAAVGGLAFPSRGWTTIAGGVAALVTLGLAMRIYERAFRLRNVGSYPLIQQFRKDGWSDLA